MTFDATLIDQPNPKSDDPMLEEILKRCYASTQTCATTIFPERFYNPFPSISDKIFKTLDTPWIKKAAIAAPRGWGKTSSVNMAYPAKHILFGTKKFIVPISNTATQAEMQSENLKWELTTNKMVEHLFGNFKSDWFSKKSWVTSTGTMVLPRGAGQQVRGILYGHHRPDLIICDDMEDSEEVRSAEQREKKKEWFFADVCNAINRSRDDWKIVVIGTILHEDSLLQNLLDDPEWFSIRIELCDDHFKSSWPDYMDDEAVKKLADSYSSQGMLDVFFREYRNLPISTKDAVFRKEYFKYFLEDELPKGLETVVIVDPARTVKLHSAESAIIGVSIDPVKNRFYVRDIVSEKFFPDQLYQEMFNMCQRLEARVLAVEETGLKNFISYPIKNEIIKRGLFGLEYVPLQGSNQKNAKERRVAAMAPLYRMGMMYHNKTCCAPLEAQLLRFPRSALWDIMDALSYVPKIMDEGYRYFDGPDLDPEDEYKELDMENDPPLENWRLA